MCMCALGFADRVGFARTAYRVPGKSRVMTSASQLRRSEYQHAEEFPATCDRPSTKTRAEQYSVARDAMSPNRDSSFQDVYHLLSGCDVTMSRQAVRIFDLEQ